LILSPAVFAGAALAGHVRRVRAWKSSQPAASSSLSAAARLLILRYRRCGHCTECLPRCQVPHVWCDLGLAL